LKVWVGVDVSKLTLDLCWFQGGSANHRKVANAPEGFAELLAWLPAGAHLVMEATGAYYLGFASFLQARSFPISVVNPLSIKRFAQMKLARAKTDKYDAALITHFGASQNPPVWSLPDAQILELQQLCTLEEQLLVNKGALANQVEAFSQNPWASAFALQMLAAQIQSYEQALKTLEGEIEALAKKHYPRQVEILRSIPGMGKKTTVRLLVATKGFREAVNGRALCSYIGIAPRPHQSGTSVKGRGRISKMGNRSVRNKLYMCAMTAIRLNVACKAFYTRLRKNGKAAKVALIAVASKLLRQAAAMIQKDQLFDEKLAMGT
jgi:transposase